MKDSCYNDNLYINKLTASEKDSKSVLAPDNVLFSSESYRYFSYFSKKTNAVGTH